MVFNILCNNSIRSATSELCWHNLLYGISWHMSLTTLEQHICIHLIKERIWPGRRTYINQLRTTASALLIYSVCI